MDETYLDVYRNVYSNHSDKSRFYPKAEITDDGVHGVRKIEDGYELVFSLDKYSPSISVGTNISLDLQHIKITKVGTYAYYHLPQEMNIEFDDSVKEIDKNAFRSTKILTLELNNVEVIQSIAFPNCTLLNSIDMGNVKYIGSSAFYNCTSLKKLNTKNVIEIEKEAFYNCTGLVVVECPNVVTIKDSAFYGLKNLVKVSFDKIKTIEANNFTTITNLKQVWFYNEESMEGFVCKGFVAPNPPTFYSIFTTKENYQIVLNQIKGYGLNYRYVGDISGTYNKTVNGVTVNLGEYIVGGDENNGAITSCNYSEILEDYDVPSELTCITRDGEEITKKIVEIARVSYTTVAIDRIKITFPESIKTIGGSAFEYWNNNHNEYRKKMHKIDFGGVETIGNNAFSCKSSYQKSELIELKMPNVKTIGTDAFYHADQLLLVEFGKIESIGSAAFTSAKNAQQVIFYNEELIDTSKLLSFPYITGSSSDSFKSFKVFATSNNLTNIKNIYKTLANGYLTDGHFAEVGKKVGTYTYTRLNEPINLGKYMVKEDENGNGCITSYIERTIDVDYEVPSELDGTTITSIGNYAYYSTKMTCDNLTFGDSITSIGSYAFGNGLDNKTILNVNFNNVETIGSRAFVSNKNLEGIEYGNVQTIGTYAFQACTGLTMIEFSFVSDIGNYAFQNCTGLIDIKLSNVNTVGNYAFSGCSNIVSIDFGTTLLLGDYAFQNLSSIEEIDFKNVESLGKGCFSGAKKLVNFNDDNKIKTLNQNSFGNCVSLVKAVFPELLTIGTTVDYTNAFGDATSLVILDIGPNYNGQLGPLLSSAPNLHQFILRVPDFSQIKKQYKFYSNMGRSVNPNFRFYAPASTRSAVIGIDANYTSYFSACSHILGTFYGDYYVSVKTPNSGIQPVNIHEYCVSNYSFISDSGETSNGVRIQSINYEFSDAEAWKNYRLPSEINGRSVVSLGYNSFRYVDFSLIDPINESNENFAFPDTVKNIYHSAFRGTSIRVSNFNKVEQIEDYSFEKCENIYIIESNNIKYAGNYAFSGCKNLLKVNTPNLIEVGNKTFASCTKMLSLMTNVQKVADVSNWYSTTSLVELSFNTDPESTSTLKLGDSLGTSYIILTKESSISGTVYNQRDITQVKKVGENWIDAYEADGVTKIKGYSFNLGMYYINSTGDEIHIYRILARTINEDLHIPSVLDDENPREVKTLGRWAFASINFNNHQVYLPATVEVIGSYCFYSSSIGGTLDLKNATTVYQSAFYSTNITNVIAPKLNDLSNDRVFHDCTKLEEVYLPNVTKLGGEVFYNCTSLKYLRFNNLPSLSSNIKIREGNTIILEGDITDVSQINTTNVTRWLNSSYTSVNASTLTFLVQYESLEYYQQTKLNNYNLSYYGELYEYDDGSGKVDKYLLEALDSNNDGEQDAWTLLELISSKETIVMIHTYNSLPITHIRANAFSSSSSAKSITLPKYYSYYEDKTLNSAISIQEVLVDAENTNFKSIDGVLYNYSLTELIAYPSKKINEEYIVNDGTLVIRNYAFYNVENLRHLVINKELLVLGSNVFDETILETIEFTSSTTPYITSSEVFNDMNFDLVIYVPDTSLSSYQSVNAFQDYKIDLSSNKASE